ncbi:MAG: aminoacyl-tRNA hydrolase [Burkholderiales bacterium]|nr:aminoacyl-tRNA hydrolase [Burkholderiales bacterium]
MIKLIVGLGNPGREYEDTRHNAGFWFVEEFTRKLGANFSLESKYFGYVAKAKFAGSDIWLLKPQTYMNLSGKSVQSLASFYKITPEEILVVHDELDFKPGTTKMKQGGGNGGHNGLKDIDRVIGKNYWRLRIGIGHPGDAAKVAGFVLNRPTIDERVEIDRNIDKALSVSDMLLSGDFANAQKSLHTK